jgi:hypothetical protein
MPRPMVDAVMDLETLYWIPDPLRDQDLEADVDVWPVFFKIDGATASVSDAPGNMGKLMGTATTSGTTGVGAVGRLKVGGSVAIPPEIGRWTARLVPIPLGPGLMLGPDTGAIFGAAVAVVQPSDLGTDALIAGHAALNAGVQTALDTLIANLAPYQQSIDPADVDALAKAVQDGVEAAVKGALSGWDQIYEKLFDLVLFGNTLLRFNQDDVPIGAFDQMDFDPASEAGPTPFPSGTVGQIGLSGAISQARRQVGQGALSRFDSGVRAVAGYADASGFQHAIVGTDDGMVSELWWQPPAAVGRGTLSHFDSSIVALDGFYGATGYHHVIVATSDHLVTELWWQGPDAPGRGTLYRFSSPITAVTGFYSGDGYHHAIVATQDGNLAELWWQGPEPAGQGNLTHLASPVVDLAGYWTPDGVHHVIAATKDGTITELRWSGSSAAELAVIAQVEAYPWSSPIGIGAYDAPADGRQHAIVAMSDGVLRELHWAPGDSAGVLHDDLGVVADMRPLIGAYFDASGYQHAIASSRDGVVHELWWPSLRRRVTHGWDNEVHLLQRVGSTADGSS